MIRISSIATLCLLLAVTVCTAPARADELPKKIPVTVKADKLDYDRTNDVYTAVGHVKVEQDGMRLEADKVTLNNKTGDATAEGKVYLQEKGDVIRADRILVNINTKAGLIFNGDLFMNKDNLHVKGEKIERRSETVYHVENGTFTTCDAGEWYLKAGVIDVDMDRYATGSDVSFNMIGLPVLYTPYLLFPVRRQTGLLIPEAGYSSKDGFLMKNSLFWAISDYQDMTFYSDYRAHLGIGTAAEYRYVLSRDSGGKLFYNYFNTFNEFTTPGVPDTRWLFSYQHHEYPAEDLTIRSDINLVSDYLYFPDLESKKLELRALPYLDSNLFAVARWDTASLYLLGQYAIDLTQQSNDTTIQKLPELRYNLYEEKIAGPVRLNVEGFATNFTRKTGDDVLRADFDPRLSAALGVEGLTLTPRLGARVTYYDRSASSSDSTQRRYYYAGADLNGRFSRTYGADRESGFGQIRHSIEPGVTYSYIPKFNQNDLPQLDVIDTVTQQNLVSVSLINRLTAHYRDASGFRSFDLMVFRVSESYDINKARSDDPEISGQARSEIRGEIYLKTPKLLTLSATEIYTRGTFTSSSESITVNTGILHFNITRQALAEPKARYVIGGAGAKAGKWDLDVQIWRDVVLKQNTQQDYKVHYASQCWGLGFSFTKKPGETQYMLTMDLKGLGVLKF
ncbi:MAG TPA: LPS assembly protein LptD [Nitrospirota bacterium]|nr:LPS assembly protein LptD [Nitrospirota bacterium]